MHEERFKYVPALSSAAGRASARRLAESSVLMKLAILFVLAFPLTVVGSTSQELVVSEQGYFLDGMQAENLADLEPHLDPDGPAIIEACVGADISRLIAAMDWLTEKGRQEIAVRSVRKEDQELCGEGR